MTPSPPFTQCICTVTACFFAVACGGGYGGTGPLGIDSGAQLIGAGSGRPGGSRNVGSGAGIGVGGGGSDATAPSWDSAAPSAQTPSDAGLVAVGDGGGASGGAEGGGVLCGPNGTVACGHGQQCDTTLGCVDCLVDSQCPAASRFCVQGLCVQCKTSGDCGIGTTPACWPANHTCHAACTSNQQCQNGAPICNAGTGVCVGCNSAADCPSSQSFCDTTTQQCVQCTSTSDCAGTSTPVCARNRCVPCASNADCSGATPYCMAGGDNGAACVQCLQNAQCPPSLPKCSGGTCGKGD
jgi:hypothetical protein